MYRHAVATPLKSIASAAINFLTGDIKSLKVGFSRQIRVGITYTDWVLMTIEAHPQTFDKF